MFKLSNISIRSKLIFMLVFTSVLVLGIFFVVFILTDIRAYKKRKLDDMISLAQVIGTNSVSTLQFRDNEAATKILEELYQVSPEIIQTAVLDKNDSLFAIYSAPGAGRFQLPPGLLQKKSLFAGERLYIINDIFDGNDAIGKVFLEIELSEISEIVAAKYRLMTILLFAALGFAFIIAIVIQTYISRRLLNLVNTMNEVSHTGDYGKSITDRGKDEISMLVRGFNNLMQQVRESQQKKDEFIGIASHELKTPLTSVKGYVQLLEMMEDREQNKQIVQKALDNVNKLERLVSDLLDVSRIQSGQLKLTMSEFSIDDLLDETIASLQVIVKTHEITREGSFGYRKIMADRQRIEQVFINLLSNAVKYSPGENKVIVYCEERNDQVLIRIRDFGIGVPREEHMQIFERFYRTKDSSVLISGFGLGLYICRDIVARHHGKIWVETEEKGSTFYLSLPVK